MKILVRGDCTSRRFAMLNRSKFHTTISLVTNEKAPNAVFADHLNGIVADPEELYEFVDESKMGKSQLLYFRRQFERNVLSETGASLLVVDPYSEMNFQLWKHRKKLWRFWIPKAAISNEEAFSEVFESTGYESMENSVRDTATVINHIVENNKGLPVLFLPQILDYYPALDHRAAFNDMGGDLAKLVPGLHVGERVPYRSLVPEDLGTGGGPDKTLHFSGETYWKCARPAIRAGLLRKVEALDKALLSDAKRVPEIDAEEMRISLLRKSRKCIDACETLVQSVKTNLQQYFVVKDRKFQRTKDLRYRSAIIDLSKYRDYPEYESFVKKSGKGARIRQRNKAANLGYYVKQFHWRMHIPDIYQINTSTDVRSGGQARGSLLRTVEELGGAPDRRYVAAPPKCPYHWAQPWGVFEKAEGHTQGTQVTDERLVGYIFLRRFGEFLLYSQILGHYDYLQKGIMILLHHEIMRWVLDSGAPEAEGVKAVMYAGYDQGTEGLREWKRREGFEPFLMVVSD